MTIEFNCPSCGALIAFDSRHAGRSARCLTCGQKLVIPAENFQKPEKIAPPPEPRGEPVPGFYRVAFVEAGKSVFHPQNVTTLAFIAAIVCFKFFLARGVCGLNFVATVIVWGWLFGFYLNIIAETTYDENLLPKIYLGTSITFLWYVIQPFFVFFFTLFLVELPFFITLSLTQGSGVTLTNFGSALGPLHLLLQFFFILGLFLFPAAILTTAVGKDITLLRPDYLLAPVFQAFGPYVIIVLMLATAFFLQIHTTQYTGAGLMTTAWHLAINLAVQVIAIFAMRAIGLFYRHYACYFKW